MKFNLLSLLFACVFCAINITYTDLKVNNLREKICYKDPNFLIETKYSIPQEKVRCIRVIDGDTFVAQEGDSTFKVRLADIDCPETGQSYGNTATNLTKFLIDNLQVTISREGRDNRNRVVAQVYRGADNSWVNETLVTHGLAWVYNYYNSDSLHSVLYREYIWARERKAGLWAEDKPEPPFKYRERNKKF